MYLKVCPLVFGIRTLDTFTSIGSYSVCLQELVARDDCCNVLGNQWRKQNLRDDLGVH